MQLYKPEDYKRVLETVLLVAAEPVQLGDLKKLFDEPFDDDTWRTLLDDLRLDWADRGIELVQLAGGWRFQTRPEYQGFIERLGVQRLATAEHSSQRLNGHADNIVFGLLRSER